MEPYRLVPARPPDGRAPAKLDPEPSGISTPDYTNVDVSPLPGRSSYTHFGLPTSPEKFLKKSPNRAQDVDSAIKKPGVGLNPELTAPYDSLVVKEQKENPAGSNPGFRWKANDRARPPDMAVPELKRYISAGSTVGVGLNPDDVDVRPKGRVFSKPNKDDSPDNNPRIGLDLEGNEDLYHYDNTKAVTPSGERVVQVTDQVQRRCPDVSGPNEPRVHVTTSGDIGGPNEPRGHVTTSGHVETGSHVLLDVPISLITVGALPTTSSDPTPDKVIYKSTSKTELNVLLESIKEREPSAVALAKIPLSFSTISLQRTADQADGSVGSKPVRNRTQERKNTDLLSAVFYSKPAEDILKLLENGGEIRTKCRDTGASLLHIAALNADPGIAQLLMEKGCDVWARDKGGKLAVHVAAWEGALPVLQMLCETEREMASCKVQPGSTYVNVYPDSWNHNHQQITKYWKVMAVISEGSTPLHVACRRTKESCVKYLMDVGAEPEEDSNGLFPVDVIGIDVGEDPANRASDSSEGSLVGIAKLLIGHQRKNGSTVSKSTGVKGWPRIRRLFSVDDHERRPVTALHTAVGDNNINLITILLDEGADVLVWNECGATPLHLAVKKKFLDALRIMLRHGDNCERRVVNAVDMKERSLLHLAVEEEWTDGISILLEENADITCKNTKRETVLHLDAAIGNVKILTELLTVAETSTIINSVDNDCCTPIHKAVENNHLEIVKLLIENGAKAEIVLPDGRTLLHICSRNDAEDLMKYLLESTQVSKTKENKTSVGEGGMTALHIAASLGHSSVVEILLKHGCNVKAKTDDGTGSTALHLAAKFDRIEVARTILEMDHSGTVLEAKDDHGWYPLHVAAGHGHEECVDMLLRAGADIALTVEDEQRTKFTGLDIIMTCVHRPVDFLVKILDSYIIVDSKVPVTNPRCKIEVDFDFLLPNTPGGKQLGVLEAVLNNGSEDLEEAFFLHPVVQTFIYLKSKNMFLFFALFFDLFFLLAFYLSVMAYHGAETLQQPLYRYILIGLLSVNMLFEVINVVRLQRYYIKDAETWIKWIVYCNILVVVVHPTDLVLRYNMAVSILLSWTELLLVVAKYPVWGIYVLMFATVAGTILKVLAVFSLLLVGFAFTFRALFREKGPFSSVWSSMVKVLIMVYELDYRGTMEETSDDGPVFTDIARFFYLLFVLMVSMSLVNLMLGLAVSDIADLKRKGRAKRLAKQVAFLGGLENLLFCWPLASMPRSLRYRNTPSCLVVKAGSKLNGAADSPVPKKLKEAIIDRARSVQQAGRIPECLEATLDSKKKEDTVSVGTRRSISASYNRINVDRSG